MQQLDARDAARRAGPFATADSCYGAQFTKYLTSYRKIIANLSPDRLTIVTYNVLKLLLGIS